MRKIIKGFKVTDSEMKCRGFQFSLNKEFVHIGEILLCNSGFHFCELPQHCFNYYDFISTNRVFEIEAYGDFIKDGDKSCTSKIKLIKELEWQEVLKIVNTGIYNTGYSNTGNSNTGDRNTGDRNTGNSNTGDSNTGYRNTGYSNTGYRNTGNWNTGYWNTGNWNTGDSNTGNSNTGDSNTGYRNTGDSNTGDRNTGNWNTGYRNTGYSNTGYRNTGAFCTGESDFPMFNKPSNWTESDFKSSKAYDLLCNNVNTKIWVQESQMTFEEKQMHPSYKTVEGYLKDISFREAFQNAWHNFDKISKQAFIGLPNFDADIFEEITGVKIGD